MISSSFSNKNVILHISLEGLGSDGYKEPSMEKLLYRNKILSTVIFSHPIILERNLDRPLVFN